MLDGLPSSVDKDVRQGLADSMAHLRDLISTQCQRPTQTQPTQTQTQTSAKGGPHKGAVNCTIPFQSFTGPQGTFTIQGTATGFLTPRSH